MCWYLPSSLKLLFCDILRMICHTDLQCGSINFHKQRKQPEEHQYLETGPFVNFFVTNKSKDFAQKHGNETETAFWNAKLKKIEIDHPKNAGSS